MSAPAPPEIRIGTRASTLARTQSTLVAEALTRATGRETTLVMVRTEGDVNTGPLAQLGGTGVFVSALREALLRDEGMCLGLSSGINVAGAMHLARDLGPGKTVVTILCDTGFRYLSSLYNADWLRSKGLPVFPWLAN